jgi:hypothetical protein
LLTESPSTHSALKEYHEHPEWPAVRKICDQLKNKSQKYSQEILPYMTDKKHVEKTISKLTVGLNDLTECLLSDKHLILSGKKLICTVSGLIENIVVAFANNSNV